MRLWYRWRSVKGLLVAGADERLAASPHSHFALITADIDLARDEPIVPPSSRVLVK
ncbi:hypothetical protein [Nitrosomonas sp. Nm58]|uniref:hypothetical protein n=1 Tax=Nitrosomonas sp. Nm58 TaxID=200126 RepID=UPI0015A71210|nr:hypothetical protein [Nitrosomonas sp. Nm58]